MSIAQIIEELPKLNSNELSLLRVRLDELSPPSDEECSPELRALIESRLEICRKRPESFIPIEVSEARMRAKYSR